MIASSRSLVIFANAPEKGRVKSRIAADLGQDVALTAYRTLAEHAVAAASHVDWCRKTIAYAPNGTGDAMRDWFGDLFDYRAQGDGDLGRRMLAALERAFADGADRVILIGVDCPGVSETIITEAFARLDQPMPSRSVVRRRVLPDRHEEAAQAAVHGHSVRDGRHAAEDVDGGAASEHPSVAARVEARRQHG